MFRVIDRRRGALRSVQGAQASQKHPVKEHSMMGMSASQIEEGALAVQLAAERDRLVRLCARLTGDAGAAEDLAQETLLEAWRSLGKLRTPDELAPWLGGIARNICLRWARSRG